MSGSGRWTPPPERVQADAAVEGNRVSRRGLWVSVVALALSLLFSAAALWVSLASLSEQESINEEQKSINDDQRRVIEDQIRANNETRVEKQLEYAIRVAWWESARQLNLTNRSPVPIKTVMLRYRANFADSDKNEKVLHDDGPVFMFTTIAPCTSVTIDRRAVEDYYLGPREERPNNYFGITDVYVERVDFTDVHGRWGVASGARPESIDPVNIADFDLEGALLLSDLTHLPSSEDWIVEQPASDCGTG
jgi:hypothetical protein